MANQFVSNETTVNQKSIRLVGDVKDMKTKSSTNVCQLFQHNGTALANSATTLSQPNMCTSNTELPVNDNLNIDINNDHQTKKYDVSNNASSSTNIEELSKCHEQNVQLSVSSLGNNLPNDFVSNEIYDENDLDLDLPNEFVSEQHNDFINKTSNIDEDDEDMELHETINQSQSREERQNPPQSLESHQQEDLNSDDELEQKPIASTGHYSVSFLPPEISNGRSLQVLPTHHQNAIQGERQINEQSVGIEIDQETEIVRQQIENPKNISNEKFKQLLNEWNNQYAQRVNRTNRTQEGANSFEELNRLIYVLLNVQTALSRLQSKPSKSKPAFPMLILPEDSNNSKNDERNVYFFSYSHDPIYEYIRDYIIELLNQPDNVTQKINAKNPFLLKILEQKGLIMAELVEWLNMDNGIFKVQQPEFVSFIWAFLQTNRVWCWKNFTRSIRNAHRDVENISDFIQLTEGEKRDYGNKHVLKLNIRID